MQLPLVAPAPIVTAHADLFRDLCENRCPFHPFQHSLTGLIVLDHKRLATITRCVLERADKTTLARFFSAAPWCQDRVPDRRLVSLLQHTKDVRRPKADALLSLEAPVWEPVGRLFDSVARQYNQGDAPSPRAHHPGTRHYGRGPGRFPVDLRLSRR